MSGQDVPEERKGEGCYASSCGRILSIPLASYHSGKRTESKIGNVGLTVQHLPPLVRRAVVE